MFDVAIIGAGPAGSTLARLLGRHCKVALFEKRDLESADPGTRNEKCCGGLLAPDAQRAIAALGLGLPRRLLADPQLFAVRSWDMASGRIRHYQRHYLNIDRLLFDRWLYSLVPEPVVKLTPCLVSGLDRGTRAHIVRYFRAGREYALEARLVVGADGASSLVRARLARGRDNIRRYFAVEQWFEFPAGPPFFSALFDPAVTDFYAWTIPKNGELIVGAALDPERRPLEKFERLKRVLREQGLPLSRPVKTRSGFLLRPCGPSSIMLSTAGGGRPGPALAGEAAGLVSPSSGEGISFALESAARLAAAILKRGENFHCRYAQAAAGLKRKISFKILKAQFLYHPWLRRAILASGVRSVPVEADGDRPVPQDPVEELRPEETPASETVCAALSRKADS